LRRVVFYVPISRDVELLGFLYTLLEVSLCFAACFRLAGGLKHAPQILASI
jgi:hypothetical protein